ncbi:hypothetical protein KM043_013143 [Ampulex compressa]|nr:hypothetical protein KM043_013143 [Ampulex compressa]
MPEALERPMTMRRNNKGAARSKKTAKAGADKETRGETERARIDGKKASQERILAVQGQQPCPLLHGALIPRIPATLSQPLLTSAIPISLATPFVHRRVHRAPIYRSLGYKLAPCLRAKRRVLSRLREKGPSERCQPALMRSVQNEWRTSHAGEVLE